MLKSPFKGPFKIQNIRKAEYGLSQTRGETVVVDLVDSAGKFAYSGGLEETARAAIKHGWAIDNETEARYHAFEIERRAR